MVRRNKNMEKLHAGYLFPEIGQRKKAYLEKHPGAKILSLGIGNTTEPLTPHVVQALQDECTALGTTEGYNGYGDEQGLMRLREKIARVWYHDEIKADEIFISDGAKCDVGRLQLLFGSKVTIAIQDPSYPVYVDGSVIIGATRKYDPEKGIYEGIIYMTCTPENNFFPDLRKLPRTDLIYFCSPNNPTGAAATREQLIELVHLAQKNRSIILFDAAYAAFIQDENLPKTIFEIPGATEVAVEINSFSKTLGFTGVRLGWSVVPKNVKYDDGTSVNADWNRITTTLFNGASNIAQKGALAALDTEGLREMQGMIEYYMKNAQIIRKGLEEMGYTVYGGDNAPYIWVQFPGMKSWDIFNHLLEQCQVIVTPGSGFGPSGEGFVRFSAFGHREDVIEAMKRLKEKLGISKKEK